MSRDPRPGFAKDSELVATYPVDLDRIPDCLINAGSYQVRFARSACDLERILELRYQVFNLELGEGLDASHETGRDEDDLDVRMHHLMITHRDGTVVGTYRMQTVEMALRHGGFYSAGEFALDTLPSELAAGLVEIGRACVAKPHRNGRVLSLLWRGLAAYLMRNGKHSLFGCCSLTSQDEALGLATHAHLFERGAVHPTVRVLPLPDCRCWGGTTSTPIQVPALFESYLQLGAKVLGPPAIDRQFKTIDWLVYLDTRSIDPATYQHFFR